MFNKEKIFNKINKRNGLLVSQLYNWLPEDERPNRKYFTEYLRKIPGVILDEYSSKQNVLFATTSYGTSKTKKNFLIMVEEFERYLGKEATFIIKESDLPKIYKILMMQENNKYIHLEDANNWINYYLAFQQQTLKRNNTKREDVVIDLKSSKMQLSMDNAPWKPKITLLQLFKRNIFMSSKANRNEIYHITFHLLDIDDNLTRERIRMAIAIITEFLAYHRIGIFYSLVIYTWSMQKMNTYQNQVYIKDTHIERINLIPGSSKKDVFKNFRGVSYVNLNLVRFFNMKSGATINEHKPIKTIKFNGIKQIKKTIRFDMRDGKS